MWPSTPPILGKKKSQTKHIFHLDLVGAEVVSFIAETLAFPLKLDAASVVWTKSASRW